MTTYEVTLVAAVVLFTWGILRFFRQIVGGEVGGMSVILMLCGGMALAAANTYSPDGVKITDVVPAFMHVASEIRRAFL